MNVTDVRRERITLLRSTVGETVLAKGFCSVIFLISENNQHKTGEVWTV